MQQQRGAVTAARMNGELLREFAALALGIGAALFSVYASLGFVLAHRDHPSASLSTVAHLLSPGATAFVNHLALALFAAPILIALVALIGCRHFFARSGDAGAVAYLLRIARALCSALRVPAIVATGRIPAEPARDRAPDHSILEQLRAALVIAPSAPPANRVHHQAVNTRSFISRRSLA
ncbi:MAG: hypothetical protein ACRD6W_10445 [Nitrososphaerales archaeon]